MSLPWADKATLIDKTNDRRIRFIRVTIDFWIARVLQERGEPTNLQLGAAVDEHVSVAQLDDETRAGIDEVRILGRFRHRADFDLVAPNFTRERSEIREGGDDFEFGVDARCQKE